MVETRQQKLNATKLVGPVITVVRYNLRPRPTAGAGLAAGAGLTAGASPTAGAGLTAGAAATVVVRRGTLYYNLRPRK